MKKQETRCERITRYEKLMDEATEAVARVYDALEKLRAVQDAVNSLDDYYTSDLWKEDFAADEAGFLPQDLKRGVLSEDGLYNLLEENRRITMLMDILD